MIKGKIEQRTAERVPFETGLQIKFINSDGKVLLEAYSINLSAGGLKFYALGSQLLELGEKLEFTFTLPHFGEKKVEGEICYREIEYDQNQQVKRTNYGVKFIAMPLETWNYIMDFCYQNEVDLQPESNNTTEPKQVITIQNQETKEPYSSVKATIIYHERKIEGVIEDLSFGGVRIRTKYQIPINANVNIAIQYHEKAFFLNGICIWNSPVTDAGIEPDYPSMAGIFFNSLQKNQFDDLADLINILQK